MMYCESDKECHAMLLRESTEIAKQEAVTVKPGAPQGNRNAVKGYKTNGSNTTSCFDSANSERHSNTGLLRRLAKQGRDDLLDRVASGETRAIAHGAGGDCEGD
jgi:hypothetical protein